MGSWQLGAASVPSISTEQAQAEAIFLFVFFLFCFFLFFSSSLVTQAGQAPQWSQLQSPEKWRCRQQLTRSTNWLSSALSASREAEAAPAPAATARSVSMVSKPLMMAPKSAARACMAQKCVRVPECVSVE